MPTVFDAWPALLLLGAIIASPWVITWVRRSGWQGTKPTDQTLKVLAAVAVGPQQRVVAVEVVVGGQRTCLVLGITPQAITRLDVQALEPAPMPVELPGTVAHNFNEVLRAQQESQT